MMFVNDEACIAFMKSVDAKLEELIAFLGEDPDSMPRERAERARDLLKDVKSVIRGYVEESRPEKIQAAMSQVEKDYCYPAIQQAMAAISVGPNLLPTKKWMHELMDAQEDIRYFLMQLEGPRPGTRQ